VHRRSDLAGALLIAAALSPSSPASAQSVNGAFAPSAGSAGADATLVLDYSGFKSESVGLSLLVYYDSTKLSPGPVTFKDPPGSAQGGSAPTAGTLTGCAGADRYVKLAWVDYFARWPTPPDGTLASLRLTVSKSATGEATVCWVDDSSDGGPQRHLGGHAVYKISR